MKTSLTLVALLLAFASAEAQLPLVERLRERIAERRANAGTAAKPVEMSYGRDSLQKLDYWRPTTAGSPLVVFVHGGGWKRGDRCNCAPRIRRPEMTTARTPTVVACLHRLPVGCDEGLRFQTPLRLLRPH